MRLEKAIEELESGKVRFDRLVTLCSQFFGKPRISGSHHVFKMPWPGDPRINVQRSRGGEAKPYQVQGVLHALRKLLTQTGEEE